VPRPTRTATTEAERARAFDRALFAAAADTAVEQPWGLELRTPTLPLVRNLNGIYADGPVGEVDLDGLRALAISGIEAYGPDGWERDLGVYMAHRGAVPDPDPRVREVPLGAIRELRREWLDAEVPRAEIVEQLLVSDERVFTRTPTRAYLLDDAATALLIGDGPVRMVEDVYTTPARRREGLASAVVNTAVATAYAEGVELVFLPTSAGGDAQRLYAKLGFADLAHTTLFFRPE
jgi:GNAT superfamily N-acetyltransferase